MKRIFKTMLLAAVAAAATIPMSCSDSGNNTDSVLPEYEKKHDTAILLVTFGSTWVAPHQTYTSQQAQFQQEFRDADIFFSFTSETCINRWKAATGEQFVTPDEYLKSFIEKGYEHVYVQSLHVIPGEEFMRLRDSYVKPYYNFKVEELGREPACCGEALLKSDEDIADVAKVLVDAFATQLKAGHAVAFMGHGNPISDYDHANASYRKIEADMKAYALEAYGNDNVFVGTVDYPEMLVDYVVDQLKDRNFDKTKTVYLHPLMSIAGDHANNDMADPDDEESWLSILKSEGWTNVETVTKGLGDYSAINDIWIRHLHEAIASLDEE